MKLETEELDGAVLKVTLSGRMDNAGVDAIAVPFAALNARAQGMRGGATVLLAPRPLVEEVLQAAGVPQVVPIVPDLKAARAALAA